MTHHLRFGKCHRLTECNVYHQFAVSPDHFVGQYSESYFRRKGIATLVEYSLKLSTRGYIGNKLWMVSFYIEVGHWVDHCDQVCLFYNFYSTSNKRSSQSVSAVYVTFICFIALINYLKFSQTHELNFDFKK